MKEITELHFLFSSSRRYTHKRARVRTDSCHCLRFVIFNDWYCSSSYC